MKTLNIGLIGYGFMGRAHSNAYRQVNHFFDLPFQVVPKVIVGDSRCGSVHTIPCEASFATCAVGPLRSLP